MLNNLAIGTDPVALVAQINAAVGSKVRAPKLATNHSPKKGKKSARLKKVVTDAGADIVKLADVARDHRSDDELGPLLQAPQLGMVKKTDPSKKAKPRTMVSPPQFAEMVAKLVDSSSKRRVREGICHALITAWEKGRLTGTQKSAMMNYFVGFDERGQMIKSVSTRIEAVKGLVMAMSAVRNK